jgi:DNA-binding MarR family transcriptional regulator
MGTEVIYEYLERIANLIRTDIRKAGIVHGLQPVQLEALHYLSRCNRYSNTPVAVAEFLGLTKGTVSQTLGILEVSGLIVKQADARDRRVVHLTLTEAGHQVIAETIPPQILRSAVERLPEDARQETISTLNRMLRELQIANGLKTFGACRTCKHHRIDEDGTRHCNLTSESLTETDAGKICREHDPGAEPRRRMGGV